MQELRKKMTSHRAFRPVSYVLAALLVLVSFHGLLALTLDYGPPASVQRTYERLTHELSDVQTEQLAARSDFAAIVRDVEAISVVREVDTAGHAAVREHILAHFAQLDHWETTVHTFKGATPLGEKTFNTVIATWAPYGGGGTGDQAKRVILSAHYDSKVFAEGEFVGAMDSAVSCALLLDVARTLSSEMGPAAGHTVEGVDPHLSLQLVFFDGEEAFVKWTATDSIYGARQLAYEWHVTEELGRHSHQAGITNIELFFLLDLLGAKGGAPMMPSYFPATKPVHKRLVALERRLIQLGLLVAGGEERKKGNYFFTNSPYRGYGMQDDHVPFLRAHVPVVHLIPPRFPPCWHEMCDNLENVDWQQVEDYAILFRHFVAEYFRLL